MRKLMKATCSIIIVCMLAVMAACTIEGFPRQTERVFVDRTEGWENRFPYRVFISLKDVTYMPYEEKLFHNVHERISLGTISKWNIAEKAEEAAYRFYGEESIDWNEDHLWWQAGNNWFVWCGETLVVIDSDGKLLSCFNKMRDPLFTIKDEHYGGFAPFFEYEIDFAQMSEAELLEINDYVISAWEKGYIFDLEGIELPLSAEDAFKIAVRTDEARKYRVAQNDYAMGEYKVYYSEISDAYFIITCNFIEAVSKEEGKLLLLSSYTYSEHNKDASVKLNG